MAKRKTVEIQLKAGNPVAEEAALVLLDDAEGKFYAGMKESLQQTIDRWELATLADGDAAAKLSEALVNASLLEKQIDIARLKAKESAQSIVDRVNELYNSGLRDPLRVWIARAKDCLLAYQEMNRQRIQRERQEAERLQVEAARAETEAVDRARAAKTEAERTAAMREAEEASRAQSAAALASPAQAPKGIRTDTGTTSETEVWQVIEIDDQDKIPDEFWLGERVQEALLKDLNAAVRGGARAIPGCIIGPKPRLNVRQGG